MFTKKPGPATSARNTGKPTKVKPSFLQKSPFSKQALPRSDHKMNVSKIVEEPIPPPPPPRIIQDTEYTVKPTKDRQVLLLCTQSLAAKTLKALESDRRTNQRFARRLVLSNRPVGDKTGDAKNYERFEVELPLESSCWNDMDVEMIEYLIIDAIIKNTEIDHVWFKVRVEFDHFLSKEAKMLMDQLDEQELGISKTSQLSNDKVEANQQEFNNNGPVVESIEPKAEAVVIFEDEDDEIEIVYTSVPR